VGTGVDHEYAPHIALIRDARPERSKQHPARRWLVERIIAWLHQCRGILIRWDDQAENGFGLLKLVCALLWFRRYTRLTT
jgi:transposase